MPTSKTSVLITGANTGLGLEIVRALAKSTTAYDIIIGCRSVSKGEAAVEEVKKEIPDSQSSFSVLQIDVESDESITKAAQTIATKLNKKLDVLVNNAGANFDGELQSGKLTTREAWLKSWNVNVAGGQVVTETFMPLLLESSNPRLLFITSGTSSLEETTKFDTKPLARINASPEAGWPKPTQLNPITIYRSSKTGLNMLVREWHRVLKNDGVKVWAVSPGFLATGLAGIGPDKLKEIGAIDPSEGGNFVKSVIEGARDADVGTIIRANAPQPW